MKVDAESGKRSQKAFERWRNCPLQIKKKKKKLPSFLNCCHLNDPCYFLPYLLSNNVFVYILYTPFSDTCLTLYNAEAKSLSKLNSLLLPTLFILFINGIVQISYSPCWDESQYTAAVTMYINIGFIFIARFSYTLYQWYSVKTSYSLCWDESLYSAIVAIFPNIGLVFFAHFLYTFYKW